MPAPRTVPAAARVRPSRGPSECTATATAGRTSAPSGDSPAAMPPKMPAASGAPRCATSSAITAGSITSGAPEPNTSPLRISAGFSQTASAAQRAWFTLPVRLAVTR